MSLSLLNIAFEFCCLCISLFFLTKNRDTFSKITIGYLCVILLTEITGSWWRASYHKNNSWIFNIYSIFEAGYICFGFHLLFAKKTLKASGLPIASYIIFITIYTIEALSHGVFKYHIITNTVVSICFVLLSLYYFYLLMSQEKTVKIITYSSFWWVAAILIYYFGGTMYNLFMFYIVERNFSLGILVHTMLVLNFLLYSIWSYSYICSSRHQKLLPSLQ